MAIIRTKEQLRFYIKADRIMNGYPQEFSFKRWFEDVLLNVPPVIKYLENMRKLSFYKQKKGRLAKIRYMLLLRRLNSLSVKCAGLYISEDVCGYGLVVPHQGTIRIGSGNKIGKYAVIQTMVIMISSRRVVAGNGLYLSVGSKVIGPVVLGNGVTVAANSVVSKNCGDNCLLAGMPASVKKEDYASWYERDGVNFKKRIEQCEALRVKYGLPEDC